MRTANPALRSDTFTSTQVGIGEEPMTIAGTVQKSFTLLAITMLTAGLTWTRAGALTTPLLIGGAIGGFIVALVLCFKKTWAPALAPAYALLEGLFLGGLSKQYEAAFGGIVLQAVMLTFGTFLALLATYQAGFIRATENFKLGIVAATGGIFVVYLLTFVLGFFGIHIPYIHGSGPIGIGFSIVVVIIAALNLVLDFDFIEKGAENRAPRYLEWYAAFGLLVTLVWLYIEILRLLAKLRQR
ncbi:MAG: Bax inhibitor-1/YccA family protein [Chthoniobacteraceae bacterium]